MTDTEDEYNELEDDSYLHEDTTHADISDTWEEFKETMADQWDLLCNDPLEFASQYWELLMENKGKTLGVIFAIFLFFAFARGGSPAHTPQELAQQRFTNLSRVIKAIVEQENDIQPMTSTSLRRSFVRASRRLTGMDGRATSNQPVVLLFAAKNQAQIHLLVQKFTKAVSKYPDIFATEFDCDHLVSRMEFEKNIFTRLHNAELKQRLLILNNIDRLSETAPLVLHSLADNESSPFKDVVIIATITLNELPAEILNSQHCNRLISDRLLNAWTAENLSPDQVYPIISRLSGATICYK